MFHAWVPHYREPFFNGARDALADRGIDFELVHGEPYGDDAAKGSAVRIDWAHHTRQRVITLGDSHLAWQSGLGLVRGADLVIFEQAASQLALYPLFVRSKVFPSQRLALWGHGVNFQRGRASSVGEAVKRWISRRVDWWFSYNDRTVSVLCDLGFPSGRITNLRNAIDTSALVRACQRADDEDLARLGAQLGISSGQTGVYVGGMYREKRLGFLLESCDVVRELVPDFHMIFIGDGPEAPLVRRAAERREWMHYLGAVLGEDKVPYMLLARLHLMPGLVGLTVLDSFALGVPLVTVADSEHSPEFAYLEHGQNGLVLEAGATPRDFAREVADLLDDDQARQVLVEGCLAARDVYTVEAMIERFVDGVEHALTHPPRRRTRATTGRTGRR